MFCYTLLLTLYSLTEMLRLYMFCTVRVDWLPLIAYAHIKVTDGKQPKRGTAQLQLTSAQFLSMFVIDNVKQYLSIYRMILTAIIACMSINSSSVICQFKY